MPSSWQGCAMGVPWIRRRCCRYSSEIQELGWETIFPLSHYFLLLLHTCLTSDHVFMYPSTQEPHGPMVWQSHRWWANLRRLVPSPLLHVQRQVSTDYFISTFKNHVAPHPICRGQCFCYVVYLDSSPSRPNIESVRFLHLVGQYRCASPYFTFFILLQFWRGRRTLHFHHRSFFLISFCLAVWILQEMHQYHYSHLPSLVSSTVTWCTFSHSWEILLTSHELPFLVFPSTYSSQLWSTNSCLYRLSVLIANNTSHLSTLSGMRLGAEEDSERWFNLIWYS